MSYFSELGSGGKLHYRWVWKITKYDKSTTFLWKNDYSLHRWYCYRLGRMIQKEGCKRMKLINPQYIFHLHKQTAVWEFDKRHKKIKGPFCSLNIWNPLKLFKMWLLIECDLRRAASNPPPTFGSHQSYFLILTNSLNRVLKSIGNYVIVATLSMFDNEDHSKVTSVFICVGGLMFSHFE